MKILSKKLLFFLLLLAETSAMSQRLTFETTSSGPTTRVIYGRITTKDLWIFEKKYPLELGEQAAENAIEKDIPAKDSRPPDSQPSNTESRSESVNAEQEEMMSNTTALTSFTLKPDDVKACTKSKRFIGFLQLAKALNTRVNNIRISSSPESEECAEKITRSLNGVFKDTKLETETSSNDGVRVELGVTTRRLGTSPSTSAIADVPSISAPISFESMSEILKYSRVLINDQQVIINPEGFFIFEVNDATEEEKSTVKEFDVEILIARHKPLNTKIYPATLTAQASVVTGGLDYTARQAVFGQSSLKIFISETPFLTRKTTIDGGLGGGIGYGREVPGERRGQRLVAMLGIDRRQLLGDLGAKTTLFYTSARSTAVPATYTLRGVAYHDWSFFEERVNFRLGGGLEIFSATIKQPKYRGGKPPSSVLIPSLVSAPLLSFGMHTVLFHTMIVAPTLGVTPLYVQSAGYYPSLSPTLELGFKFKKTWILTAQMGYETHRFPSNAGETKLQLDYGLITLKRGIL